MEFLRSSQKAGDNRRFYCTIMEPHRGGVLYMSFITHRTLFALLFSLRRKVFEFSSFRVFNAADLIMLFQYDFFELSPSSTRKLLVGSLEKS